MVWAFYCSMVREKTESEEFDARPNLDDVYEQ